MTNAESLEAKLVALLNDHYSVDFDGDVLKKLRAAAALALEEAAKLSLEHGNFMGTSIGMEVAIQIRALAATLKPGEGAVSEPWENLQPWRIDGTCFYCCAGPNHVCYCRQAASVSYAAGAADMKARIVAWLKQPHSYMGVEAEDAWARYMAQRIELGDAEDKS